MVTDRRDFLGHIAAGAMLGAMPFSFDGAFRGLELPSLTKPDPVLKQTSDKAKLEQKKRDDAREKARATREFVAASRTVAPAQQTAAVGRPLAVGFYVNWDDSSLASLKQNIQQMDWVVPEWIRLSGDANNPLVLDIDVDACTAGIHGVFEELLDDAGGSLDDLAGGDLVDDQRRQLLDSRHPIRPWVGGRDEPPTERQAGKPDLRGRRS